MKEDKLKGIILRKTNYSESDIIFEVLTDSGAVIGFFARGARKIKSRFSGVIQLGHVVSIAFDKGKNLNYPKEISIDKNNLYSFYSKSIKEMNFYVDVLTIAKAIAKDLENAELFTLILNAFNKAERGEDLIDIYNEFLDGILCLIGADTELKCSFSGDKVNETEFFYIPETNKVFSKNSKPRSINAELIGYDKVFQKNYLQKLAFEYIHHKLNLKF